MNPSSGTRDDRVAARAAKQEPKAHVPLAVPDLRGREEEYAVAAIRSSWISSTGEYVSRFEDEFGRRVLSPNTLAVTNGTVALHLALLALGIGPGDEVVVPSLTYVAAGNAVRYVGATPVFAEVDPGTWCLDPAAVAAAVTSRTSGILTVHLYGHPSDMDGLQSVADKHGLWILEDAAEAHFARYRGRPVGPLGTVGTFSFYGNKILTSGEGGAVVTRDDHLAARMRLLRGQGMDPTRRYYFPITGHNFRLTNVACALLCAQLERADELVDARRTVAGWYREALEGVEGIGFQPQASWAEPAPWLFCITVDREAFGCDRDRLMLELERQGIETRPFFIPLHRLPPFLDVRHQGLDQTERIAASGMNLPTHSFVTQVDVERIADVIRAAR